LLPSDPKENSSPLTKEKEDTVIPDSAETFSISTRIGIMTALLGSKRATFTELLLAVKTPKSSLNKSLGILEDYGYVKQHRGFLPSLGPRTIVEITPKGEEAIRKHLELMRALADKFLGHGKNLPPEQKDLSNS
jgi:DNA-binding MarR family transcriptional regulator